MRPYFSPVLACLRHLNHAKGPVHWLELGLGIMLLAALTGCVGYVEGGYVGPVVVPGPDLFFWGGGYEGGHEVHAYSHRGYESRAVARPFRGGEGRWR